MEVIEYKRYREYRLEEEAGSGQKAEIAAYCGKHKENYYILDTQKFWQAFWCKR